MDDFSRSHLDQYGCNHKSNQHNDDHDDGHPANCGRGECFGLEGAQIRATLSVRAAGRCLCFPKPNSGITCRRVGMARDGLCVIGELPRWALDTHPVRRGSGGPSNEPPRLALTKRVNACLGVRCWLMLPKGTGSAFPIVGESCAHSLVVPTAARQHSDGLARQLVGLILKCNIDGALGADDVSLSGRLLFPKCAERAAFNKGDILARRLSIFILVFCIRYKARRPAQGQGDAMKPQCP